MIYIKINKSAFGKVSSQIFIILAGLLRRVAGCISGRHGYEETSQQWRAVGDSVQFNRTPDLPHLSRYRCFNRLGGLPENEGIRDAVKFKKIVISVNLHLQICLLMWFVFLDQIYQLHIVGGFGDDRNLSENLCLELLQIFASQVSHYDF